MDVFGQLEALLRKHRPASVVTILSDGTERAMAQAPSRKWSRIVDSVRHMADVERVELRDDADSVLAVWSPTGPIGDEDDDALPPPRLSTYVSPDDAEDDRELRLLRLLQDAEDRAVDRTLRTVERTRRVVFSKLRVTSTAQLLRSVLNARNPHPAPPA